MVSPLKEETKMRPAVLLLAVLLGFVVQTSALADIIHVPADYPTIQGAIKAAADGDEIIVHDGVYTGPGNRDLNFDGKLITVRSANGPEGCIIDCQADWPDAHRAFIFMSGETELAVVDGFTITNCFASFFEPGPHCDIIGGPFDPAWSFGGGGMLCLGSSPTVKNCVFEQNHGGFVGGGMYNCNSHPKIVNCTFSNNAAHVGAGMANIEGSHPEITDSTFRDNSASTGSFFVAGGGGMLNVDSNPIVANCTFARNSAAGVAPAYGGGMGNLWSSPTVIGCRFIENFLLYGSAISGGGMGNDHSAPTVVNCVFIGNVAVTPFNPVGHGGGMGSVASNPVIINSTFVANIAEVGGGMRHRIGSNATVVNCIVWDNIPDQIEDSGSSTISVSYSDVQGGYEGIGNIDVDPLFVQIPDPGPDGEWGTEDDDYGDLHLQPGSPCIDAGDNEAVPPDSADLDDDGDTDEPIPFDLDGNPRFVDGDGDEQADVDMGAYEFQTDLPCPWDLNGDGVVGPFDLAVVLGNWGPCKGCPADLDGNSQVGPFDLALLLGNWGPCP